MTVASSPRSPLPGTRPEGTPEGKDDQREAARAVREMFSGIAPRYDFLNHFLSLSLDRLWRRRTAQRFRDALRQVDVCVLDLCCGTGDLAFAFERVACRGHREAHGGSRRIIASDFAHPMLVRARAKAAQARSAVKFVEADALRLPFPEASFDLLAVAFGLRNLANYECGLREIHRVLRPGGTAAVLEFSMPRAPLFGAAYRFYFEKILPRLGGVISGNRAAYSYLPSSVAKFPTVEELATQMSNAGFVGVSFESWTGGVVTLHTGRKTGTPKS